MSLPYSDSVKMVDAVRVTTTSAAHDISKRQQVTVQLIVDGGTTSFSFDVSNDGTNWVTGVAFLDATATAVGTYVTSKSITSTTGAAIITPGFRYIRVVATVTTGLATAILQAAG